MKLLSILLVALALSTFAHADETMIMPGYGYVNQAPVEKTDAVAETAAPVVIDAESTEVAAMPEPTLVPVTEELVAAAPAPAPAKPAHARFDGLGCTHIAFFHSDDVKTTADACELADKVCSGDFANFYKIFYCTLDGSWFSFIVFMIICIFLIFKYTAIVVDEYIVPGLTVISTNLQMSEALSAVTLLALANGAGDVITALVSGSGAGGVSYNIGSLYGAGLFVAVAVVSICIFQSKDPIEFDKMIIYRDVGIYIFSTLLTLVFAAIGYVDWWMALLFLVTYGGLVSIVVVVEKLEKKKAANKAEGNELAGGTEVKEPILTGGLGMNSLLLGAAKKIARECVEDRGVAALVEAKTVQAQVEELRKADEEHEGTISCWDQFMEWLDLPYIFACQLTCMPCNDEQYSSWKFFIYGVVGIWWGYWVFTGSFWGWGLLYGALPVCFLLELMFVIKYFQYVDMPEVEVVEGEDATEVKAKKAALRAQYNGLTLKSIEKHRKNQIAAKREQRVTSEMEKWGTENPKKENESASDYVKRKKWATVNFRVKAIYEEVAAEKEGRTLDWFKWISTILGIIAGLMWTYVLVGFLIDLLNCFGTLLGLDNTYLGLTILAVGNALPDALTTISLCKTGQATMALAGGYAGQLFGLLVGFGLAQLKTTLIAGPQTFDLFNPAAIKANLLDLMVLGVALVCLVFTFVFALIRKFQMSKVFAAIASIIYGAFILAASIIAISNAVAKF